MPSWPCLFQASEEVGAVPGGTLCPPPASRPPGPPSQLLRILTLESLLRCASKCPGFLTGWALGLHGNPGLHPLPGVEGPPGPSPAVPIPLRPRLPRLLCRGLGWRWAGDPQLTATLWSPLPPSATIQGRCGPRWSPLSYPGAPCSKPRGQRLPGGEAGLSHPSPPPRGPAMSGRGRGRLLPP